MGVGCPVSESERRRDLRTIRRSVSKRSSIRTAREAVQEGGCSTSSPIDPLKERMEPSLGKPVVPTRARRERTIVHWSVLLVTDTVLLGGVRSLCPIRDDRSETDDRPSSRLSLVQESCETNEVLRRPTASEVRSPGAPMGRDGRDRTVPPPSRRRAAPFAAACGRLRFRSRLRLDFCSPVAGVIRLRPR